MGEQIQISFGAEGSNDDHLVESDIEGGNEFVEDPFEMSQVDQVPASTVRALDAETLGAEDDSHFDDVEHVDDSQDTN